MLSGSMAVSARHSRKSVQVTCPPEALMIAVMTSVSGSSAPSKYRKTLTGGSAGKRGDSGPSSAGGEGPQ